MSNDNKTLAEVQPGGRVRLGDQAERARFEAFLSRNPLTALCAGTAWEVWQAALSAQPSPGGQGDLKSRFTEWVKANGYNPATFASGRFMGDGVQIAWEAVQALAAPQPVGEPVEHDCTNCDRKHAEVICPTCAGIAWDNGRLHEFHEVRELSTSLGEGVLDHLLPDEWHEKPLLRFQGAYDEGDDTVGISPRSANVLAEDQTGTVLGDYLAARQPVGEPLWCLHVLGMDDVHPAPSKAHAEKAAAWHNEQFKDQAARLGISIEAKVVPWPHSAESHAAGVAEFIPQWLIPQWQLDTLEANAAQPAQAVDLGAVREAVRKAWQKCAAGESVDLQFGTLLALIDSQAVGNG